MSPNRWRVAEPPPDKFAEVFDGFSPIIASILFNRGLTSRGAVKTYLAIDKELTADPLLLPGMDQVVPRVLKGIADNELIGIYGDFDTDGVTATALLVQAFEELGISTIPYIPHRVEEGHGLNLAAVNRLRDRGCTLIITADCGINGMENGAVPKDVDLIVTDHHLPSDETPSYFAAINAHLPSSRYPYPELTGVGIAFKLVEAIFAALGRDVTRDHLELVALGTIADVGSLMGENRYLVHHGLDVLRQTQRVGLRALADVARVPLENVDAESIGFALSPRLNAAGRMQHAMTSFQLLTTRSDQEAKKLALELDNMNLQRRNLTGSLLEEAYRQIDDLDPLPSLLMVGGTEFLPGICGLVAGRIAEELYIPAISYRLGQEFTTGSARSIPEFNITAAFDECADLLVQYGGHRQAAGFKVKTENLSLLRARLEEIAYLQLNPLSLEPTIEIDAEVSLAQLSIDLMEFLGQLEPCGEGNRQPTFLSMNVRVADRRRMGDGSHVRLQLSGEGVIREAVAFRQGHRWDEMTESIDVIYHLRENRWRGKSNLQMNIIDFRETLFR
jgi:single-stranded-DNA-specific exonuclease